MMNPYISTKDLIQNAIRETDAYLGIEKEAKKKGFATTQDIYDFSLHMLNAVKILKILGDEESHREYMQHHVGVMNSLSDQGAKATNIQIQEAIEDDDEVPGHMEPYFERKSKRHDIPPHELKDQYKRGIAAAKSGKLPISPELVGKARVNQYIRNRSNIVEAKETKEKVDIPKIDKEDLEKDVKNLDWKDIIDLYDEEELVHDKDKEKDEKQISEAISAQSRIKKSMNMKRSSTKINKAREIKLRRTSSLDVLKRRAKLAARRLLMKRLLRGRKKTDLSASEKDRIESQLQKMGNLQNVLMNKLVPKIRDIEKQRLASPNK